MSLLLLWSVFLVLNGLAVSAQELSVSMQFQVPFVVVNNHATTTCQAINYDSSVHTTISFSWQHNGTTIDLQESRYSQSGDGGMRSLDISNLRFEDAGTYTCTIAYSLQSVPQPEVSGQATLQIATELTVEAEPVQYSIIGQTAQLRCTVESNPSPRITWYRGEMENIETRLPDQGDFGVYAIPNVQLTHAGNYLCTGSYSFGRENVLIELVILNEPTITSQFNGEVQFRSDFIIPCNVSPDSQTPIHPLSYQWNFTRFGTSESVALTDEHPQYSIADDGGLTVAAVVYQDAGTYTCIVRNEAGTDKRENVVTVVGPARITLEEGPITERVGSTYISVFLHCPVIGNPQPTLKWFEGERRIEASDSNFHVHSNGTLQIFDLSSTASTEYRCDVGNSFGNDTRMYTIQVWEIPPPPSSLVKTTSPDNDRTVTLIWMEPSEIAEFQVVEFYIIEQSLNGGQYEQLKDVNPTGSSVTLPELLPGERYEWRVKAKNIAGVSAPSNVIAHMPAAREPSLSNFQVTPLSDGRSVLVRWTLDFDGGPDITEFTIQALINDTVTVTQSVDVREGQFTLTGLEPETQYIFKASAVNLIGTFTVQDSQATTPAIPSQPSSLSVTLLSSGSYSLTFTIKQGSSPISHYLINYTQVDSTEPPSSLTVATDDPVYVTSMLETDSQGRSTDTEYQVVLSVAGLDRSERFEFRVAGRSELGDGEFSEWARIPEKGHVIYIIIAVVAGGMLLVVMVIMTAVIIAVCRKKCNRGRKIAINGNGSPFPHSDMDVESNNNSDAFILKSPPIGRTTGSFHKTPPVCITPSTEDRDEINSPLYSYPDNGYTHSNGSSVNKLNTQTSISGSNLDTVVDMPNNNLRIVKEFHSSTKSVPNTSGYSPPTENNRQHLCLQTSLNSMNLDHHGEHNDGRSIVSEKHLLVVPTTNGSTLSKSTPVIHRLSCESVLDTAVTSYMTDV